MSAENASPAGQEAYAHAEEASQDAESLAAGSFRADAAAHEEPDEQARAFACEPEAVPAHITVSEPEQPPAYGQAVSVGSPSGTDPGPDRSDATEVLSYSWKEEPSAPVEQLAEECSAFAACKQPVAQDAYAERREAAPDVQPYAGGSRRKVNDAPPARPKKVKPIGKLGVGYGSLAVFLALLLFVSLTAAAVSTVAAVFLTEDGLKSIVDNIDIKDIKVKDGGRSVTVSELIYDKYREFGEGQGRSDVSEDVIGSLLEDDAVSDLAAELLEDYRSYFLDGGSASGISAKRIADYIDDHKAELRQALKNAGYEKDVDVLTDGITAALEDIDIGSYSITSLEDDHSVLMAAASLMLSKVFLIISWVLTAVWLILLICTTKRRVSAMFPFLGVPVLILGILFCAASAAGVIMPMFYDNGIIAALVNSLVYPVLLTGSAAVFLGIILIMIGSSIKSHRKKAAEAAEAEAAQA